MSDQIDYTALKFFMFSSSEFIHLFVKIPRPGDSEVRQRDQEG